MAVEIKKSILAQQVEDGWKRKALADHYGLSEVQMADVLRKAGLKIRKFHAPKYQLVDDTIEVVEEVTGEDVNETLLRRNPLRCILCSCGSGGLLDKSSDIRSRKIFPEDPTTSKMGKLPPKCR